MTAKSEAVAALRARLAGWDGIQHRRPSGRGVVALDRGVIDATLGGGLVRGAVHELTAAQADAAALFGIASAMAAMVCGRTRPVLWVRGRHARHEAGGLNGEGFALTGLDPAGVILAEGRDMLSMLRAGEEGARYPGLGTVVIEAWGRAAALDLTTTRRLALAAERSGVTVLLARAGENTGSASAALTRWQVAPAMSRPLAMNAPGHPAFRLTLSRHRCGVPGGPWCVEWNRDAYRFVPSLPGVLAAPASDRPAAPAEGRPLVRLAG